MIDCKVTVEGNGQVSEVRDYGGSYAIRTLKSDREIANANRFAVQYIPANRTVVFDPEGTVARAEFSALLIRALGISVEGKANTVRFADVSASAWYASAVNAAVSSGLFNGIGDGRFAPKQDVTRAQAAAILNRFLTYVNFTD